MSQRTIELVLKARNETSAQLRGMAGDIRGIESAASLAKTALVGMGMGFGASEIVRFTRQAIEAGSALNDLSKKTGASVEALSRYDFIAKQTGSSLEAVADAWKLMSRNLGEATSGNKAAAEAFASLGLSAQQLKGLAVDQAFETILSAINALPDTASKTQAAMDVFGRGGAQVLQMADSFRSLGEEAKRAGLIVSTDMAKQLDDLGDRFDKTTARIKVFSMRAVVFAADVADSWRTMLTSVKVPAPSGMGFGNLGVSGMPAGGVFPYMRGGRAVAGGGGGGGTSSQVYQSLGWAGGGRIANGDMGYGPAAEWYSREGSGGKWDMGMWDEVGGKGGVSEQIREAQAQAKEYATAMWDSADASAQMADNLARAKSEAVDQLASGMLNVFGILSGGNARWVAELQRVYQLYLAIRAVLGALNVLSLFSPAGAGSIGTSAAGGGPGIVPMKSLPNLGGMVSPMALSGAGGGGATIQMVIGNPVSRMDALDLGRRAAEAASEYSRRFM